MLFVLETCKLDGEFGSCEWIIAALVICNYGIKKNELGGIRTHTPIMGSGF